jgi:hypothetical protein
MEPESGGKRAADQLQSGAVQDKAVPTHPDREDVAQDCESAKVSRSEMVVIRMQDRLIKGYLETRVWEDLEELLRHAPIGVPEVFRVQRFDTGVIENVPVSDAKAVFYVKSFEGNDRHKELNFYARRAIVQGIWVRIEFQDGEVMEGIVHNSIHYFVDPGFFLLPTDPGSNNKLVYVIKKSLKDCCVLGLREI